MAQHIDSFAFNKGRVLARKYEVMSKLGAGWESEVYLIREKATGIERAAKFFFPHRNVNKKTSNFYAKKLHKLRNCPALIQYHTQEQIQFQGQEVTFLISDFVEGEVLMDFLKEQPGKRIDYFQGLHLLHSLSLAIKDIHRLRDYHGDLHSGNVIIRRHGLGFDVKLLDFFHWGAPTYDNLKDDVIDAIKLFHETIGGPAHYAKQPQIVKDICCGLKKGLILKKFRTIGHLIDYLESMEWGGSNSH